jgi:hypothetical protein
MRVIMILIFDKADWRNFNGGHRAGYLSEGKGVPLRCARCVLI